MNKYSIILLADNDELRKKGLMFTEALDKNECAFFIFPKTSDYSFWNKNVSYPLDLAFCDENLKVVAIKSMDANSEKSCRSGHSNIKYVIEAINGAFEDVNVDDYVILNGRDRNLYFSKKIK